MGELDAGSGSAEGLLLSVSSALIQAKSSTCFLKVFDKCVCEMQVWATTNVSPVFLAEHMDAQKSKVISL